MVKIKITVSLPNEVGTDVPKLIESNGFKITRMGDIDYPATGQFIYAEISKELILELAKLDGIYIEQVLSYTLP